MAWNSMPELQVLRHAVNRTGSTFRVHLHVVLTTAVVALCALGYVVIPHATLVGTPPMDSASESAALERAAQRGALWVATRTYPRPSAPDQPLEPEPDVFDAAFAQWLGKRLQLPVEYQDAEHADLQLQGFEFTNAGRPAARAYGSAQLQLVGRRQELANWAVWARHHLPTWWQRFSWLHAASTAAPQHPSPVVCVGAGVAPRHLWSTLNARPHITLSSIHAISDFLAGQCDLLAEEPGVVQRLLQQTSWRFYGPLGKPWNLHTAAASEPSATPAKALPPWLHHATQQWLRSSEYTQALQHRASTIVMEAALLEDGAICH